MNICLRCFELKEMYHGRDCRDCRTKYLKVKRHEKNRKTCPFCRKEHNEFTIECGDKCKILNRHKKINGCWEWQGKLNADGYGSFNETRNSEKKEISAHRRSYEIFKGQIPQGMQVCHSCDNPSCCNPEHLWIGTSNDNTRDSIKKGRRPNEKKRAIAAGKLTEEQVKEIRESFKNGSSPKELHEKYKISQSQISGILTYRFWRHVT